MADTILKPTAGSGNKLVLQSGAGNSALEVLDGGNISVGNTITTGTLGNAVSVANCIIKKWHHFTHTTRSTPGNSGPANHFAWTTAFTPIDPVNNGLWVVGVVPCITANQNWSGYGLRFDKSGGGSTDFFSRGIHYAQNNQTYHTAYQNYSFNIAAGTLAAGTYTIHHRIHTTNSNVNVINPNSSDQARHNPQLTSELMIREYKNP